jgi:adenylate kinase family enzyme
VSESDTGYIGTGDLIRKRIANDPKFKSQWETVVARGDLVPDEVLIPMVNAMYVRTTAGKISRFIWDGWCRNPEQVKHFISGFAQHSDRVKIIHINASHDTCQSRNNERLVRQRRIDGGAFERRWFNYISNATLVVDAFQAEGIEVVPIDGDQGLEQIAFDVRTEWRNLIATTAERVVIAKQKEFPSSELVSA